jgi:hypothetical protein
MNTVLSLDYIAAFFDGEGCASIVKTNVRSNRRMRNGWELTPTITITQKRREVLELMYDTLTSQEIGCYLYKPSQNNTCDRLKITGIKRIKRFCEVFIPLTYVKKEELEVLLEYCNYRLSQTGNKLYTDKDLEFFDQLQELKKY